MKKTGKSLFAILLTLIIAFSNFAIYAAGASSTVDNSVDKSTTQIVGKFVISCKDGKNTIAAYDSGKVKVDYKNPQNDYVQSLIQSATDKLVRLGQAYLEGVTYADEVVVNDPVSSKSENSFDNRIYTWVNDDESDGSVIFDGSDVGSSGSRHMVIDGDYGRITTYTVTVEVVNKDHAWDKGVVTKEATENTDGVRTFTCRACNKTKTEVIPKLNPAVNSVSIDKNMTLNYKDSKKITPAINADNGVKYTVEWKSADSKIASVSKDGTVTGTKKFGKATTTITCTVTDSTGNVLTDTCNVTAGFTWWQWIIGTVLFGFIWY